MSVFGRIMDRIFRHKRAEAHEAQTPQQSQLPPRAQTQQGDMMRPPIKQAGAQQAPQAQMRTQAQAQPQTVDIEAVLSEMAANNPQKLNWRASIVDLMKLVGMESSLAERKELAQELGYTGDMNDSATMNIWLHKQVMRKLAENGGKVPTNLMD